jgi:uncharacterized membrane protein YgcG
MKKSKSVILGALALAAAATAMTACDDKQQDVRSCTDRNGQIVDDKFCQAQPQTANGQNNANDQIIRDILLYHWVFGGQFNSRRGYVYGGGWRPASPSVIYVSPYSSTGSSIRSAGSASRYGAVSRGGFGGSFSGGHGESGGE